MKGGVESHEDLPSEVTNLDTLGGIPLEHRLIENILHVNRNNANSVRFSDINNNNNIGRNGSYLVFCYHACRENVSL